MDPRTVKSQEKLTKRRLSTSNVIAINYILCNLIGAAVFLQAAQVHAIVPRLPLRAWESDYARLVIPMIVKTHYSERFGAQELPQLLS